MKLNLSLRLNQEANISISILDTSSYTINSRTLNLVQSLYIVQTHRNILKPKLQFSYSFNRNAFICMVRRSCSQITSLICFSAHKQWLNCSIVLAYQNKSESTKILIIFIIKEDSLYKVKFPPWNEYYHKNKACCILMGIKNFAKNCIVLLLSICTYESN